MPHFTLGMTNRKTFYGYVIWPPCSSGVVCSFATRQSLAWAWIMIQRSFVVGGAMGLVNGCFAGLVIVFFVRRACQDS